MNVLPMLGAATAHAPLDILSALALILCVAAVTTVLFQRIHQPVVLGYLLAGLLIGPHVMFPLFASVEIAHLFADLGVILLMFCLGLEFSLRKLARVAPTAGIIAVIECSLMVWLGYTVAGLFGWSVHERLFTGALVAISSTTIIVKAFAERGVKGRLGEIVFAILIVEDLIAILLLAILTTVASGAGLSAGAVAATVAKLAGFLAGTLAVGLLVVPRLVRVIVRLGRNETTVVACVGICFASALVARQFGYSVALGAFLGGLLVAESGEARAIEHLIEPVRDVFAAIFFVSVGMLIDPRLVAANWFAVVLLTVVVVVGKVFGVTIGSFIAGNGIRTSVQAGMSLAQIGEFSFIIVGVGVSLGVVRDSVYPIAVAISAVTTLLTPWLIRLSGTAANVLDRRLPHAFQTFAALYGTWIQQMRSGPRQRTAGSRIRRMVIFLFLDLAVVAGLLIATSVKNRDLTAFVHARLAVDPGLARVLVGLAAVALAAPFLVGAVRVARGLGLTLATQALPSAVGGVDLAAAPRRALLVAIQLAIVLVAGLPLVAVTQPFLPPGPWAAVLGVAILLLIVPLWRGATNLHGHVRAGAEVILEMVGRQGRADLSMVGVGATAPVVSIAEVRTLVPGIGEAAVVRLEAGSTGVGLTLKDMNLRGQTGASVIAIERAGGEKIFPAADDVLRLGDTLVLTGTTEAVDTARRLLTAGSPDAA